MPDLEVDIVIFDENIVANEVDAATVGLEIDLGTFHSSGTITDIEVIEVTLPTKLAYEDAVKNAGGAPALMVLDSSTPVPPGTPTGTVVLRKQ
jgi:hypothetical protein